MARPIDTAPKNGRIILLGDDDGNKQAGFWHAPLRSPALGWWAFVQADGTASKIPFTPTRWGETMDEFERD